MTKVSAVAPAPTAVDVLSSTVHVVYTCSCTPAVGVP